MEESKSKKQHHFVLVHGACHGAWCWYKVVTTLRQEGHRATALDMEGAGVHTKRVEEVSSIQEYCEPLMKFMMNLAQNEKVVLVGHSMGGICISLAMENFPDKIACAVFITAFMPGPHLSSLALTGEFQKQLGSYMDSHFSFSNGDGDGDRDGVDKPGTSMLFGPEFMASRLYQLSPPEDLTLATLLVRPLRLYDESIMLELTKEKYGSGRRAYIVCKQDDVLKQGFQEWMIENNPVDEVKMISGADHMVMFSKAQELCACLQNLAHKYC